MTVTYDRKAKTYISDIIEGSWPTRLDAEAAELPSDLVSRAVDLAGSLKVAFKAVRLVVDDKVKLDGNPDTYLVQSQSRGDWHVVDLSAGCDCDAAGFGIACSHFVASLLVASKDDGDNECLHETTVLDAAGSMHFSAGSPDDDIEERLLCLDCMELVESEPEPAPKVNVLIDELFGPSAQVRDAQGRVVFG